MNFKRIFRTLICLVLVLPCLLLPVSASSVYTISEDTPLGANGYLIVIPEGAYTVHASGVMDDGGELTLICPETIDIVYEPVPEVPTLECWEGTYNFDAYIGDLFLFSVPIVLGIYRYGDESFVLACLENESTLLIQEEGFTFVFTADPVVPSLQEFVDLETISPALDEIVSLLPVCLISILAYLAIRKGIAFLQEFVYKA